MTRRKERQARRNLALATAGRVEKMEERVTRVGFASVSRVEAARREVELCATSEALDQHGTIFDYAASKDAFTRWMGNVREMHERIAVGRRMAVRFEDVTRRVFVTIRISRGAEATWEKVLDGTLRGASIGATNVRWERQRRMIGEAERDVDVATRLSCQMITDSCVQSSNSWSRQRIILGRLQPHSKLPQVILWHQQCATC